MSDSSLSSRSETPTVYRPPTGAYTVRVTVSLRRGPVHRSSRSFTIHHLPNEILDDWVARYVEAIQRLAESPEFAE